ncbi:MAG: molybdotransferase-like divisome protein Glp [Nocardioides sp.]
MPERFAAPIPVEQLQARIESTVARPAARELPLAQVRDLVLAEDVVAQVALPPFANSAMDGYAVRVADVADAATDHPAVLLVVGEIGAGQADIGSIAPGAVAKIMTGAPVPAGCEAVVPYEWTDRGSPVVRISQAPVQGQHIRAAGEDVAAGDHLMPAGTRLGPRQVGLLAAVGLASVRVYPKPRVVVLSTGSELVEPGEPLPANSIFDANSYLIAAAIEAAGATARRVGIVADDVDRFLTTLHAECGSADLVVTSGGVSQGDFDVVKEALRANGAMWFGPVAMQPGKPQGFGLVDGVPVFALPGNPVSAYISGEVFVVPAIRQMMGLEPRHRPLVAAELTRSVTSPSGRRQFLRGAYVGLTSVGGPAARVTPVGGHGSHLLGGLARANALIVIDEDTTEVAAGEIVQVLDLDRWQ